MRQAYEEGRGGVLVRAKMHIEDGSGTTEGGKKRARRASGGGSPAKPLVVITELPYQTNKVGAPSRHCPRSFPGALRLPYALRGCWRGCVPARVRAQALLSLPHWQQDVHAVHWRMMFGGVRGAFAFRTATVMPDTCLRLGMPTPCLPSPNSHVPAAATCPHSAHPQAALVEQIARLVDAGTLTGVSDVRDESDRDGVRVVVEVKRGGRPPPRSRKKTLRCRFLVKLKLLRLDVGTTVAASAADGGMRMYRSDRPLCAAVVPVCLPENAGQPCR